MADKAIKKLAHIPKLPKYLGLCEGVCNPRMSYHVLHITHSPCGHTHTHQGWSRQGDHTNSSMTAHNLAQPTYSSWALVSTLVSNSYLAIVHTHPCTPPHRHSVEIFWIFVHSDTNSHARTHRTRHSYKLSAPFAADFTNVSVLKRCTSKAATTGPILNEPRIWARICTICGYNTDGESILKLSVYYFSVVSKNI